MVDLGIETAIVERGNVVAKALAVRRDQIVERSDHAFRRVAGDVDLACLVHARRDQDRVMLLAQRVKRRILADREAAMKKDAADRKSVGEGKRVAVRLDLGGRVNNNKKK